ncbi:MAG: hypothetical protein GY938_18040 [Ketobacter sp.]|nr:hypothetical protein [Ketobacter sp.]
MSDQKYTAQQLQQMATTLLDAKANGDVRYLEFVMTVSIKAGVAIEEVERRIHGYAKQAAA